MSYLRAVAFAMPSGWNPFSSDTHMANFLFWNHVSAPIIISSGGLTRPPYSKYSAIPSLFLKAFITTWHYNMYFLIYLAATPMRVQLPKYKGILVYLFDILNPGPKKQYFIENRSRINVCWMIYYSPKEHTYGILIIIYTLPCGLRELT